MSFFSDLFEGNFNQLGGDLTSPSAIQEFEIGGAAALGLAAPFVLPEIGAALGGTAAADTALGAGALDASAALGGADAAALGTDVAGAAGGDLLALPGAGAAADVAGDLGSVTGGIAADPTAVTSFTDPLATTSQDFSSFGADTGTTSFDAGTGASTSSDPFANATLQPTQTLDATTAATPSSPTSSASGLMTNTPAVNASTTGTGAGAATSGGTVSGMGGTAAPAASGGATSTLNSILSSPWTKLAAGAVPLALTLGMGEQQLPAGAQQLQAQALALQQQGLTNLQQAQSGVLNTGQTAQLTQMRADLTNQWLQTLKNQGVQDPTKDARWPQIEAAIDGQVTQQTAALIQQNIQNALAETGQASSALTSIANMQFQADQNFTNNLVNATKSLGLAAGASNLPKITIG